MDDDANGNVDANGGKHANDADAEDDDDDAGVVVEAAEEEEEEEEEEEVEEEEIQVVTTNLDHEHLQIEEEKFRSDMKKAQEKANDTNMGVHVSFKSYSTLVEPNLPSFSEHELDNRLAIALKWLLSQEDTDGESCCEQDSQVSNTRLVFRG